MSYRPKHLGHVNLYVRNAERSRQWYEDVLGLHTYHFRPGRAAFMSADKDKSHEVALMEVGDDAPLQAKRQVGLNHLAFMMESLDDLKDAYYRLKEKGVKFDHISDHGLSLGIYFRDPDGNGLEVSYELPREKWPRQESVFAPDVTNLGLFPGPWDEDMAQQPGGGTGAIGEWSASQADERRGVPGVGGAPGTRLRVRRLAAARHDRRAIAHDLITFNVRKALDARLGGKPCTPHGPNVKIVTAGKVRYPDALVTCMPIDPNASTVDSPVVVFEVVSEDTARTDRIVKLREYQATPSIQRYVILEQKSVGVSVFTRRDSDWIATALTEGDTLQMPEIDVEISIEEFYASLNYSSPAETEPRP